jgi:hypothetical protein
LAKFCSENPGHNFTHYDWHGRRAIPAKLGHFAVIAEQARDGGFKLHPPNLRSA